MVLGKPAVLLEAFPAWASCKTRAVKPDDGDRPFRSKMIADNWIRKRAFILPKRVILTDSSGSSPAASSVSISRRWSRVHHMTRSILARRGQVGVLHRAARICTLSL
jgi:hypothetical protein